MSRDPGPRIALWGHYHGGNQGDDVVVEALIAELRRRIPDVSLVGFSLDVEDTARRHGIQALPLRRSCERATQAQPAEPREPALRNTVQQRLRKLFGLEHPTRGLRRLWQLLRDVAEEPGFLWRSYQRLRGVDLVIVAGSGPLSDEWAGPWSHPYTLFKWSLLARLAGAHFAFACVGSGPIDHALTPLFLRPALRWACYRSYRDASSAKLVAALGPRETQHVFPDLAFSLRVDASAVRSPEAGAPIVGLNLLPYHDPRYWPFPEPALYETYLKEMTRFCGWLLACGWGIVMLPTQLDADPRVAHDLRTRLAAQGIALEDPYQDAPIRTQQDLLARIADCDLVVAGRFHGILLSYLLGKPVVGMAYHSKATELMRSMDQEGLCLELGRFGADDLIRCFEYARSHADAIRGRVAAGVAVQRSAIARLYDELLEAGLSAPEHHPVRGVLVR